MGRSEAILIRTARRSRNYALAHDVKRKLSKLEFLWKTSLYKTLANKHRVSISKLYRRFRISPDIHVVWQQVGDKRVERIVWRLATLSVKPTTFADRIPASILRFSASTKPDCLLALLLPCAQPAAQLLDRFIYTI